MKKAKGFLGSVGIGEIPWIKQATFSIWSSKSAMKSFAYHMQEHATVIAKTRKENGIVKTCLCVLGHWDHLENLRDLTH